MTPSYGKMKMLIITLLGYSIGATVTISALESLLSKCRSSSSYDTILGDKNAVEKHKPAAAMRISLVNARAALERAFLVGEGR